MAWLGLKPSPTAEDEAVHPGQDPPAVLICPAGPFYRVSMKGGSCGNTWQRMAEVSLGFRDYHPPTPSSLTPTRFTAGISTQRALVGVSFSADPTVAVPVTGPGVLSCLGDLQASPSRLHLSTENEERNSKIRTLFSVFVSRGRAGLTLFGASRP